MFNISVATALILFLALIPMAFIWLRRAHKILVKKNYAEVALKGGEPPENPEKIAKYSGLINLVAGGVALWILLGVPLWIATGLMIGPFDKYTTWSAIAGGNLWVKVFADFIVSRQAHPYKFGKNKADEGTDQKEE